MLKPTEVVVPPTPAVADKKDSPAATSAGGAGGGNPFAAFGKPVAELVKEASEGNKDEDAGKSEAPKPAFSFGAPAATPASEKKDEVRAAAYILSWRDRP